MSTYFSIGEISKLFSISTQTLRLYDKLELLKPAYINKDTSYRYYSIDQFVKLECIKRCKTMGLSLDEIKQFIGNDSSIEAMLELAKKQKTAIRNKIKELEAMENQLDDFEERIKESLKTGFNKISFMQNKERTFLKYDYISTTQEELEVNLRKVVLDVEEKYGTLLDNEIGFTTSYIDILKDNKVVFKNILIDLYNDEKIISENIVKVPSGRYLTMYFDDSCINNRKYYNAMIDYIRENNIEVVGDFIEMVIIPRVNKDGKENTLAKLEILCK